MRQRRFAAHRRWPDRAAVFEAVCRRVSAGEGLGRICADPDMPPAATLRTWMRAEPRLRKLFLEARFASGKRKGRAVTWAYSEALAVEVCCAIVDAEHGRLDEVLRARPDLPSAAVVYQWLRRRPAFAALYGQARAAQSDRLADKALDLLDGLTAKNLPARRAAFALLRQRLGGWAPKTHVWRPDPVWRITHVRPDGTPAPP